MGFNSGFKGLIMPLARYAQMRICATHPRKTRLNVILTAGVSFDQTWVYIFDVHVSVHRSKNHIEITNKMQLFTRIYYSIVY